MAYRAGRPGEYRGEAKAADRGGGIGDGDPRHAPDPALDPDVCAILHEEIDRLPDAQRLPVVLCDLEGLTYEQAAGRLRWTVPTLYHRLAKGRKRLRDRLIRRGVTAVAVGAVAGIVAGLGDGRGPDGVGDGRDGGGDRRTDPAGGGGIDPFPAQEPAHDPTQDDAVAVLAARHADLRRRRRRGGDPTRSDEPRTASTLAGHDPPSRRDEPKPPANPDGRPGHLTVEARDLATDAPIPDVRLRAQRLGEGRRSRSSASTDASGDRAVLTARRGSLCLPERLAPGLRLPGDPLGP